MKHRLSFGLTFIGAALSSAPAARAQEALPPVKTPPVLVPLTPVAPSAPRVTAIPIRNVPANIIAWQLDPEHNPMPPGVELMQFKSGQAPGAMGPLTEMFVPVGELELTAHWIQLDSATLAKELPAWNALGTNAWSRVATESERQTLEKLNQARQIVPVTQQLYATSGRPNIISYSPVRRTTDLFGGPTAQEIPVPSAPSDAMVIPTNPSLYEAPPYIPNLAQTDPRLPEMAPMPGAGELKPTPAMPNPLEPYLNPNLRGKPGGINEMEGFKFQLMPLIEADKTIALTLTGLDAPANSVAAVKVNEGQTAVFSLPNIPAVAVGQTRRVFLMVTPRKRATFLFQLPQNPQVAPPAK